MVAAPARQQASLEPTQHHGFCSSEALSQELAAKVLQLTGHSVAENGDASDRLTAADATASSGNGLKTPRKSPAHGKAGAGLPIGMRRSPRLAGKLGVT